MANLAQYFVNFLVLMEEDKRAMIGHFDLGTKELYLGFFFQNIHIAWVFGRMIRHEKLVQPFLVKPPQGLRDHANKLRK